MWKLVMKKTAINASDDDPSGVVPHHLVEHAERQVLPGSGLVRDGIDNVVHPLGLAQVPHVP